MNNSQHVLDCTQQANIGLVLGRYFIGHFHTYSNLLQCWLQTCYLGARIDPFGIQGKLVINGILIQKESFQIDLFQTAIQTALVDKVVEDFLDISTPLKQLTDCVVQPPPAGLDRDRIFERTSENLSNFSDRIVRTAKMVAVGTGTGNKKVAEALLATAGQVSTW